ncbi:MAG: twin-arginine translocase TatA/TatE family subunit [Verrucomicrobia bacterium]|jgi:sec-independent protein translocase protein TatA|nr:twin-arginine translocase TatA/TatE family subunit [Verrucomicrobiota bacterium]
MKIDTLAFLQNINGPEILLIFLVVLLLFGAKRLPELSRSFGKSIREFKKATSNIEEDIRTAMDEEPTKADPKGKAEPAKSVETSREVEQDPETKQPENSEEPKSEKTH